MRSSPHTDHLGSPDTISDSNGASFKEQFDPFGSPLDPPSPEITRVGFTGQEHDNDLGLIDMKGRIYDPLAGRFTTADPVMQAPFWSQGLNRYSYVFNNPVNNTDPSGFEANGEDSTLGIMGWGAATVGGAYLSTLGFGTIAGGTGIVGLNIGTSLLTDQYSLFDGSSASKHAGAAPTTAPKGTGARRAAGGGALRDNSGGVGAAKAPASKGIGASPNTPPETQLMDPRRGQFRGISETPLDAAVRALGQDFGCAMGECKSLFDTTLAVARLLGDEARVTMAVLEQLRQYTSAVYARASGIPTAADGFTPPKKWDGRTVKNPNGPGAGYPDAKGRVWIPTGDGPLAHGGPHWDVQNPGGGYTNVYPGGKVR